MISTDDNDDFFGSSPYARRDDRHRDDGSRPNAPTVSLGAVAFDSRAMTLGERFYENVIKALSAGWTIEPPKARSKRTSSSASGVPARTIEPPSAAKDRPMTPEGKVKAYLVKRIRSLGGEVRFAKWVSRHSCPDCRVMLPFEACWVETKAGKGRSAVYRPGARIKRMRDLGETVYVLITTEEIDSVFPPH